MVDWRAAMTLGEIVLLACGAIVGFAVGLVAGAMIAALWGGNGGCPHAD